MPTPFSEKEKAILAIVQSDLPDSLTPFRDIAASLDIEEEEVLALLERLKRNGTIRRFGASLRHNRTDWKFNAMVAWKASEEEAEICGPIAAAIPSISHVYYRPSRAPDWPYALYTMIHGRSLEECLDTVNGLCKAWPLRDYEVLQTVKELKKISMNYF